MKTRTHYQPNPYNQYLPDPMPNICHESRMLSSGTYGALTGIQNYAALDKIQIDFVLFCDAHYPQFDHWQAAWVAYKSAQSGNH